MSSISLLFRIRAIHLILIPVTPLIFRFLHRDFSVSTVCIPFPFSHRGTVSLFLSCPLPRRTPTFLGHLSFLKQPCQQLSFFLFRLFFSFHRHHVTRFPPWIHPLYFSISSCFLPRIFTLPFFQHSLPPSTFPHSPLSCGVPLAVPPSSVTPTSYFSMPPYPPRFVARRSLPPQGTIGGTCVRSTSIDLF